VWGGGERTKRKKSLRSTRKAKKKKNTKAEGEKEGKDSPAPRPFLPGKGSHLSGFSKKKKKKIKHGEGGMTIRGER